MDFKYKISQDNDFNVIELDGQLIEQHQADHLLADVEHLVGDESNKFILDAGHLTFINNTGFDILVSILTKARISGGDCILVNENEELKNVKEFKKLTEVISFAHTEKEKVEMLK